MLGTVARLLDEGPEVGRKLSRFFELVVYRITNKDNLRQRHRESLSLRLVIVDIPNSRASKYNQGKDN